MRNIKFRVWDKEHKAIYEVDSVEFIDRLEGRPGVTVFTSKRHGKWIESESAILIQCTGLKDKNGNDIYEGDLIESYYRQGESFPVTYEYGSYCWRGEPLGWDYEHFETESDKFIEKVDTEKWAVIVGNIYENPKPI